MNEINPFDDARPEPASQDTLRRIAFLTARMRELQLEVADTEAALKAKKEALRLIVEVELPEVMDSIHMTEFKTVDGARVTVKGLVNASIYRDRRDEAHKWLIENGHGGLVKTEVTVNFGRGQHDLAAKAVHGLEVLGFSPQVEENVHPQTLNSWAKEMVQSGKSIPSELFSLFTGRKAVVVK